ncbi:benenodin family lasso peptide [Luteimonas terrae]|uniref:Benenodin family lasso peptide n=1 Tax=Luteimonas terrae TaxID=1530191 RepID=A0ABU1XTA5_9GAMM|nr:benenodin family lasso peptide [Luteimonas terrae]MDR7191803.1 hypothetical protein [Luteimonas terrae]
MKTNDNIPAEARDEVIELGKVSVETHGAEGVGEPIGRLMLPGISEE